VTHCRQVMLEELQRRNFAPTTISTYLHAVEQFARHFKCRPDRLNQTHFRSYQVYLLRERKMQPRTVRLYVAALRFFFVKTLKRRYRLDDTPYPKAPRRLPQILSVEEVARVIDAADSLSLGECQLKGRGKGSAAPQVCAHVCRPHAQFCAVFAAPNQL
jgi:integrase/recombinase XerD